MLHSLSRLAGKYGESDKVHYWDYEVADELKLRDYAKTLYEDYTVCDYF